jgi:hypothetical protein
LCVTPGEEKILTTQRRLLEPRLPEHSPLLYEGLTDERLCRFILTYLDGPTRRISPAWRGTSRRSSLPRRLPGSLLPTVYPATSNDRVRGMLQLVMVAPAPVAADPSTSSATSSATYLTVTDSSCAVATSPVSQCPGSLGHKPGDTGVPRGWRTYLVRAGRMRLEV